MPITNGVYTPLSFNDALAAVMADAPDSIVFSPGNPPELVLANMFAEADVQLDQYNGEILAALMSPVGATIDLLNPNNPRRAAVAASGYVLVTNVTGTPLSVAPNTTVTTATNIAYQTGMTATIIPANGTAYIIVTCTDTGIGGNIPSGQAFTLSDYATLTGTNTLPFLNGAAEESDAIYLNRLVSEQTEYGTQSGSVAVETAIKEYYVDSRMYVNNVATALTTPIPVPANGYNLVVLTPNGVLSTAEDISAIFGILSNSLELVNAQNSGSATHVVMSGTIYTSDIPQIYYFTCAQPVNATLTAVINVAASSKADVSELISQANSFALNFVNRLVSLFSGVDGNMSVTYNDGEYTTVTTSIAVAGSSSLAGSIAPSFGIGTIGALVCDGNTIAQTPQIVFDQIASMSLVLDPVVQGQSAVTLAIGGAVEFINFKAGALFSDGTSWYDRYMFFDPAKINITVQVTEWI